MLANNDLLEKLDFKINEGTDLKSVNKDIETAIFTIRDKVIPKLMKNARKNEFYAKPLVKAMDKLRKLQGDLADISDDIRSRLWDLKTIFMKRK